MHAGHATWLFIPKVNRLPRLQVELMGLISHASQYQELGTRNVLKCHDERKVSVSAQ